MTGDTLFELRGEYPDMADAPIWITEADVVELINLPEAIDALKVRSLTGNRLQACRKPI